MRYIWITTEFHGTHCWPECPIDDVKFLQHEHRHTFKVKVQIEVCHQDREIEFIVFKNFIDRSLRILYGPGPDYRLGRKSCEDVCDDIIQAIRHSSFSSVSEDGVSVERGLIVEVSEDGEVGARVESDGE